MCFFHVIILFNFSSFEGSKQIWEGATLLKEGSTTKQLYVWFQIPAIKIKASGTLVVAKSLYFCPF